MRVANVCSDLDTPVCSHGLHRVTDAVTPVRCRHDCSSRVLGLFDQKLLFPDETTECIALHLVISLSSNKKQAVEFDELNPIFWEYLFPAGYVCTGIPMIQKIL